MYIGRRKWDLAHAQEKFVAGLKLALTIAEIIVEGIMDVLEDGKHYKELSNQVVWQRCTTLLDVDFCAKFTVSYIPVPGVAFCGSIAGQELCLGIGGNGCIQIGEGLIIGLCIDDFKQDDKGLSFHYAIKLCVGIEIPFDGSIEHCEDMWSGQLSIPFLSPATRQAIAGMAAHERLVHKRMLGLLAKAQ